MGIWAGALLVSGFNPLSAFLRTFDTYVVGAFVGEGNAQVLLFTFLLGGTIGLVQRSGGALGLANALKRFMGEDALVLCVRGHSRYPCCHAAMLRSLSPCVYLCLSLWLSLALWLSLFLLLSLALYLSLSFSFY